MFVRFFHFQFQILTSLTSIELKPNLNVQHMYACIILNYLILLLFNTNMTRLKILLN